MARTRKRKMGAIGTTDIILIAGVGLAAVYFLTRPKTPTPPTTVYLPAPGTTTAPNTTSQIITAGSSILDDILNMF